MNNYIVGRKTKGSDKGDGWHEGLKISHACGHGAEYIRLVPSYSHAAFPFRPCHHRRPLWGGGCEGAMW
ncbi:MAG: hypothetical protein SPK35_05895, partial [Prevotella sp.]|nr:hypothetical protein [Prevotella sp.]